MFTSHGVITRWEVSLHLGVHSARQQGCKGSLMTRGYKLGQILHGRHEQHQVTDQLQTMLSDQILVPCASCQQSSVVGLQHSSLWEWGSVRVMKTRDAGHCSISLHPRWSLIDTAQSKLPPIRSCKLAQIVTHSVTAKNETLK